MRAACRKEEAWMSRCAAEDPRQLSLVPNALCVEAVELPRISRVAVTVEAPGGGTGGSTMERPMALSAMLRGTGCGSPCFCCGSPMRAAEEEPGVATFRDQAGTVTALRCPTCGAEVQRLHRVGGR